jgi:hypothetical protein
MQYEDTVGKLFQFNPYGNCVGIFVKPAIMANTAQMGTNVRQQGIRTTNGDLKICPDAVRF